MAVVRLSLDDFFEDETFTVIAIHCVLEQYRLAYLINRKLRLSLQRTAKDIVQTDLGSSYPLFKFEDESRDLAYYIVSNISKTPVAFKTKPNAKLDLFSNVAATNDTVNYLIPELKKVTHFFKIDSEFTTTKTQFIINKILEIPQVITAYNVDVNSLKSKNNLIFN